MPNQQINRPTPLLRPLDQNNRTIGATNQGNDWDQSIIELVKQFQGHGYLKDKNPMDILNTLSGVKERDFNVLSEPAKELAIQVFERAGMSPPGWGMAGRDSVTTPSGATPGTAPSAWTTNTTNSRVGTPEEMARINQLIADGGFGGNSGSTERIRALTAAGRIPTDGYYGGIVQGMFRRSGDNSFNLMGANAPLNGGIPRTNLANVGQAPIGTSPTGVPTNLSNMSPATNRFNGNYGNYNQGSIQNTANSFNPIDFGGVGMRRQRRGY